MQNKLLYTPLLLLFGHGDCLQVPHAVPVAQNVGRSPSAGLAALSRRGLLPAACSVAAAAAAYYPAGRAAAAIQAEDEQDEIYVSSADGISPLQMAALAVSVLSVVPTAGMLGIGNDVQQDQKEGFGFRSVDDAVDAARKAKDGDGGDSKGQGSRRSGSPPKMMAGSSDEEAARQERLRQLFGEDAAKSIAKQTQPDKRPKSEEEVAAEIQMLIEGIQTLTWGQVRLIDVAMTDGPLEASFEPLLPGSSLLCVRVDMPLVHAARPRAVAACAPARRRRRRCAPLSRAHLGRFGARADLPRPGGHLLTTIHHRLNVRSRAHALTRSRTCSLARSLAPGHADRGG
jgi:hypothetical protein